MGFKRSECTDAEFGGRVVKAFDEYAEHHAAGRLHDDAPKAHEIVNQLFSANREAREAREAAAGEPVTREIQKDGEPETEQPALTAGGNSGNGGKVPAMDGRYEIGTDGVPMFTYATGARITGDAALAARARQSDPRKVRAMNAAIKGLDRLK